MSVLARDRNYGCRINDDYTYRGMRVMVMENDLLRISLLLDKGTTIYEYLYKPLDIDFMFLNNQGVRNPDRLPTNVHSLGFLTDVYDGGWHEQLPNSGNPSNYGGAEQGLHGEVCLLPWRWSVLEDTPDRICARFWVRTYRTPFLLEKTMTLERGKAVLSIDERVTNESSAPQHFMWGHHPTLGEAFLDESCVIDIPARKGYTLPRWSADNHLAGGADFTWPHAPAESGGVLDLSRVRSREVCQEDAAYLSELSEGWYAVTNVRRKVGFGQVWSVAVFPYVILWLVYGGTPGYPWYRQNYNLALEPQSSIPEGLSDAVQAGTALRLDGGASLELNFKTVVYSGIAGVAHISPDGEVVPR
ncbi:MAG: hypothetical protein B6D39_04935 [Anaerolineae bacterium UTCFX2]|jgi:hypothetical protein|nr:MAG: hypothetical protein B6D39_04935 [Anaerolineae bacterium UTCFX2]